MEKHLQNIQSVFAKEKGKSEKSRFGGWVVGWKLSPPLLYVELPSFSFLLFASSQENGTPAQSLLKCQITCSDEAPPSAGPGPGQDWILHSPHLCPSLLSVYLAWKNHGSNLVPYIIFLLCSTSSNWIDKLLLWLT